jgi:hypothetical protein
MRVEDPGGTSFRIWMMLLCRREEKEVYQKYLRMKMKTKKKANKVSSCTENSDQVKVVDLSNSVNEYLGLTPESKEINLPIGELLSDMALSENSTIGSWSKFVGNSFNGMVGESIFIDKAVSSEEMLEFFNWAKEHYGLEQEYPVDKMEELVAEKLKEYRKWKYKKMLRPIVEE